MSQSYQQRLASVLNNPDRLNRVRRVNGEAEILTPTEYLERGNAVLEANKIAINTTPHRDTLYSDWNIRYVNRNGGHGQEKRQNIYKSSLAVIFAKLGIEDEGCHWSFYNFVSKAAMNSREIRESLETDIVASVYASAKTGTMVMTNMWGSADVDIPGLNTQRLWNSELLFQAWRDCCAYWATAEGTQGSQALHMKNLKHVIILPISNAGTHTTILDTFQIKELPIQTMNTQDMITFSSGENFSWSAEFKMLMGTNNARPTARMLTDHVESLGARQVLKIHAWFSTPHFPTMPTLAFELARVPAPASAPGPVPDRLRRRVSEKVRNLMNKFEK